MKKFNFMKWLALTMAVIVYASFASCGDDDDDNGSSGNSDLVGYWVREAHLNNPALNGSSGTVTSYGFQFLANGTVYVFQLHHTGLSSRYSYAEANTSWERLTERNGVSFYINPDKNLKTYTRAGNEVYIDITSEPTIMSITSSGRMEAISLDGWAEGTYVYVGEQPIGGTAAFNSGGNGNSGGGGGSGSSTGSESNDLSSMVWYIVDNEILMGVNDVGNGWLSYVLQFGCGVYGDDAYRKGMRKIRLTVWADNGCTDMSYKTSNYGVKKTYTLDLSTEKEMYKWIYIQSKDQSITFNYNLEYYDSNDAKWHVIQNKRISFNAN
ncbi:MAG: hypothetical protein K5896_13295 [Prevotella sp.]|nr:hypothetical protein [Prevotella sp.]